MSTNTSGSSCAWTCALIGAAFGLLVAALLMLMTEMSLIQAIFLGLLAFLLGSIFMIWAFCGKQVSGGVAGAGAAAGVAAAGAGAAAAVKSAGSSTASAAGNAAGGAATTAAGLMSGAGAAASSGAKATASTAKTAAKSTASKTKTAAKSTASKAKTAAKSTTAKAKTAAKKPAAKKPAAKKAAAKKPPVLFKERPSQVDDLKLIKGVGPKLEKTCNGIGVYQFAQIANWKKADIAVVDDKLSFKGRIERDEWVKQAKILAKGGETEFSKRNK